MYGYEFSLVTSFYYFLGFREDAAYQPICPWWQDLNPARTYILTSMFCLYYLS